uniref:PDZ domain-containing protein n=1 Tax=Mesocestoides corti TaxID=53468 RepID=A0A5K3EPP3_MESCO
MFKCLPFIKGCGTHVECIDKSHASLTSVPDDVLRNYRTLEECKLDANQIKELPSAFFRLEKIRVLSVSDNELTRIPPGIGNFSSLVELDISRNDISELPPSLRFCDSLQVLDASNNSLKTLPDGFSQLRNLRVLNLNDVSLFELPAGFGALKKLQKLELRDNCLNSLPSTFGELTNLEFLDLGGNDLVTVPPSIGALQSLVELWLDDNQMTSLPDEIGNLHALQQMDLSENQLTSLPSTIAGLTSLSDLNLTQNFLDCLPEEISQLSNLTVFKLNRNQLVDLTPGIGKCQNLLEFYLTENYLTSLPNTIGNLTKMFHFNVTKNQLSELPAEIGKCVSLQILSIRDNNLRRIPSEIGNCTQLHVLDLAGNRLDRLPVSLASCPLKALWLVQSQAQPISLQRAVDETSGEEYLTCYLLPQEAEDKDASRNGVATSLSSPGATSKQFKKDLESTNGTLLPTQIPSGSSSIVNLDDSAAADREAEVEDEEEEEKEGGDSRTSGSTRVRFTPEGGAKTSSDVTREYPKTRHPMHLKKSPDGGDVAPKAAAAAAANHVPSLPSAVLDLQTNSNEQNGSRNQPWRFPTSTAPAVRRPSDAQGDISLPIYLHKPDEMKRLEPSAVSDSPRFYTHGTNAHASNRVEVVSDYLGNGSSDLASPVSSGSSGGIDDLLSANVRPPVPHDDDGASPSRQSRSAGGGGASVAFADVSTPKGVVNQRDEEEQAYSSGGEEIDTITKSVVFSNEVIDNEDHSNQKLIRRDTPHYTKRARIHSKNSDVNNEEAVLKLLKKYHDPLVADFFADSSNTENAKSGNSLLMVAAAAAAAAATNSGGSASPDSQTSASTSAPKSEQVTLHITLERAPGGGLGLSIAGGVGSVPFRGLDQGIFVSRLAPGGLAETSGLKVGDKLLEVNGVSMVNVEHQVAVSALRTNATRFKLLLSREVPVLTQVAPADAALPLTSSTLPPLAPPPPPSSSTQPGHAVEPSRSQNLSSSLLNTTSLGRNIPNANLPYLQPAPAAMQLIKCSLHRDWSGLGFSVAGGRGLLGPQSDTATIYISRIVEGGAADKSGKLRVGDQLFKINGVDVRNARHDQVITLLTGAGSNVELEVLRKLPASHNAVAPTITQPSRSPSITDGPQFLRKEDGLEVYRLTLRYKPGRSMGFAICGGSDASSLPFGADKPGVFVCRVQENGEAKQAGLRLGDRLLSVNGRDLRRVTHDEAVSALMPSGVAEESLILEVRRDPLPCGLREMSIPCRSDEPLGLTLLSVRSPTPPPAQSPPPNHGSLEEGVFVSQISPDGQIAKDGRLKPGDRLLVANSDWLMSLEPHDVAEVVQPHEGTLRLTVCDGIDPALSIHQQPAYTTLTCHMIDCDGKSEERVKPFKG